MKLSHEEIAQYLRDHPQFFEEYGGLLADVQLPHPHGGGAIPITERQIVALRDKNRMLQDKLSELIRFGEENDALVEKMHGFAVALLLATGLEELLSTFEYYLRENFSVAHARLRLWNINRGDTELLHFFEASTDIHLLAESLTHPYCGHHAADEIKNWFGEDSPRLRSFAFIALRTRGTIIGLLVMASEDPERFYPEMGTVYLAQLGELMSAALARFTPTDGA